MEINLVIAWTCSANPELRGRHCKLGVNMTTVINRPWRTRFRSRSRAGCFNSQLCAYDMSPYLGCNYYVLVRISSDGFSCALQTTQPGPPYKHRVRVAHDCELLIIRSIVFLFITHSIALPVNSHSL